MFRSCKSSAFLSSFRRVARLVTCLLAAALGIVATTNNAIACGMPTTIPSHPFMDSDSGSGDFRFSYWESLGQIRVSPKITFEIPLGFTPIPNYQNSILLGNGFTFPSLESTLLPKSENEFEMIFPSGHRETLKRTKTTNQLKGGNWLGTINGREIIVKSTCSWTLVYNGGRLKTLKTPDGVTMEFKNDTQGNYWILANGKSVLTLKPAYDANTQKIYHLNIQGGKHAVLRLGSRPVLVKTFEKDSFGRAKEKKMDTQTLTSIQWDGEPERKYGWTLNEMNVAGQLFKWDEISQKLKQRDSDIFDFVKIQGVNCLKISRNGKIVNIRGTDIRTGTMVSQLSDTPLTITEFYTQKEMQGKIKKIWKIRENGTKELFRQYWYDDNGIATRMLDNSNGTSILIKKKNGLESAIDVNTKDILWEREYDKNHRLSRLLEGKKVYRFEYPQTNDTVKVIRTLGGETVEMELPLNKISIFSQHNNETKYDAKK